MLPAPWVDGLPNVVLTCSSFPFCRSLVKLFSLSFGPYFVVLRGHLLQMFALPESAVHSIVSRMMMGEELLARWDQTTRSIVMHHTEPSRLQHLAMQVNTKVLWCLM